MKRFVVNPAPSPNDPIAEVRGIFAGEMSGGPTIDELRARARSEEAETENAALIRGALTDATPATRPGGRGVFSGPGNLARNVDRYLEETGFGEP